MTHPLRSKTLHVTVVYAKCKTDLILPLWDELRAWYGRIQGPWCLTGDLNVIASAEEKLGGLPFRIEKSLDFLECLDDCGLQDA